MIQHITRTFEGHNAAMQRITQTYTLVDVLSPTDGLRLKISQRPVTAVRTDWNEAGTAQLIILDDGTGWNPDDLEILAGGQYLTLLPPIPPRPSF